MYNTIFEMQIDDYNDFLREKLEDRKERALIKLAPFCPKPIFQETFASMICQAYYENQKDIQKLAHNLNLYKIDFFALEDDFDNFRAEYEEEKYIDLGE